MRLKDKVAIITRVANGMGAIEAKLFANDGAIIGGIVGMAGSSPYTAAKGALRSLSKSTAVEYGKDKIRLNSVHTRIIVTPMTEHTMETAMPYYETFTQLAYFGEQKDMAHSVLILASDESRFMTGIELDIEGGWTAL